MNKNLLTLSIFFFTTIFATAQYCTAVGPSTANDSNIESVSIIGESGTSISYTGCPGVIGLEDLSGSESVTLTAGNSYTLYVQFGTCGGNFGSAANVYIDFNLDQIFDVTEIVGSWMGTPPTALSSFNFTVPASITNGTGRIRIIQDENSTNPVNPCASFTWGAALDFGVTLNGGIDCSGYVGDDRNDPRIISALPFQESYNSSLCYSNKDFVYNSPDVFYELIVSDYDLDNIQVSLCGSSFDTYLSIQDLDTNVLFVNDDHEICSPQSQLTFPTEGLDTVLIIVQGWGSESGDYEINIEEDVAANLFEDESSPFLLYPNPAKDFFVIKNIAMNSDFTIFNELGQIVKFGKISPLQNIDIKELKPGIYPVQIKSNASSQIIKLIVTK